MSEQEKVTDEMLERFLSGYDVEEMQPSLTAENTTGLKSMQEEIKTGEIVEYNVKPFIIPSKFKLQDDGSLAIVITTKGTQSLVEIAATIYFIISRREEISPKKEGDESEEIWTLQWFQDGKSYTKTDKKDAILNNLHRLSMPINHNRIKENIEYLYQFWTVNKRFLPVKRMYSKLGWLPDGFLFPDLFIDNKGIESDFISFNDIKTGMSEIIQSMKSKGMLDKWEELIHEVKEYPLVMIGVYVSFASVLVNPLETDSFIFEWAGLTSSGKSISQSLAVSVWGNPSSDIGGIYSKWNATVVGIEQMAAALNHLPLFLDDTKQAKNESDVARLAYQLADGKGKARGTSKNGTVGLAETSTWKNITISTGEKKLTQFSNDGGSAARTLIITDAPFGGTNTEIVNKIKRTIQRYHGTAGKAFVKYLLKNPISFDTYKEMLYNLEDQYADKEKNDVVKRQSKHMALIELTAKLVHDCFSWDWDYKPIISTAWESIKKENEEVDRPKQAFEVALDYANRYERNFILTMNGPVPNDCYGEWFAKSSTFSYDDETMPHEKEVYVRFYTTKLEEILRKEGFNEVKTIISEWNRRGYLGRTKAGKNVFQATRHGKKVSFYEIRSDVLE
ncbi:DUF927 domain-containing protein [Paenibacillus sp. TAF43_2]|uniref:DUF927 domain-containing protein n=1 Tax=Paenibacillus sp. TAF43_2 TaxID=3233069 RepID=UPI003F982CD1